MGESSGAFLEIPTILTQLQQGLALQNYTILIPVILFVGLALYDLRQSSPNSRRFQLSVCFLVSLSLIWLAFLKHPYQIKYILPQVLLILFYWLARETADKTPLPGRIKLIALCLFVGVGFSAFANFTLLHAYSRVTTKENVKVIDRVIQEVNPSYIRFSLEVLHPDSTRAFALRECKVFTEVFRTQVSPSITVFRERNSSFKEETTGNLPIEQISDGMLIVTRGYFEDERAPLIHFDQDLDLFFYYP
jgi:hypothetical protein